MTGGEGIILTFKTQFQLRVLPSTKEEWISSSNQYFEMTVLSGDHGWIRYSHDLKVNWRLIELTFNLKIWKLNYRNSYYVSLRRTGGWIYTKKFMHKKSKRCYNTLWAFFFPYTSWDSVMLGFSQHDLQNE